MVNLAHLSEARDGTRCSRRRRCRNITVRRRDRDRHMFSAFDANVVPQGDQRYGASAAKRRRTHALAVGRKDIGTLRSRRCRLARAATAWARTTGTGSTPRRSQRLRRDLPQQQIDGMRLVYDRFTSPIDKTLIGRHRPACAKEAITDGTNRPQFFVHLQPEHPGHPRRACFPSTSNSPVLPRFLVRAPAAGARMSTMRNANDSRPEIVDASRWRASTAPAQA